MAVVTERVHNGCKLGTSGGMLLGKVREKNYCSVTKYEVTTLLCTSGEYISTLYNYTHALTINSQRNLLLKAIL
jgi:hypothetical protein